MFFSFFGIICISKTHKGKLIQTLRLLVIYNISNGNHLKNVFPILFYSVQTQLIRSKAAFPDPQRGRPEQTREPAAVPSETLSTLEPGSGTDDLAPHL